MEEVPPHPISAAVEALARGETETASRLLPLLYTELRRLAGQMMRRLPPGQTLQPTALVHEAYLKVAGKKGEGWEGRRHFFGAAARAMRDILVDQARRKAAPKHGGNRRRVALDVDQPAIESPHEDVLALAEFMERLEEEDPRKAEIVNLRFFAGMSRAAIAELLGISETTVKLEWRFARAWMRTEFADDGRVDT